jgi:hypothetical protein
LEVDELGVVDGDIVVAVVSLAVDKGDEVLLGDVVVDVVDDADAGGPAVAEEDETDASVLLALAAGVGACCWEEEDTAYTVAENKEEDVLCRDSLARPTSSEASSELDAMFKRSLTVPSKLPLTLHASLCAESSSIVPVWSRWSCFSCV